MSERVVERTYRYTIPEANELFEKFREEFSNTKLPDVWNSSSPWTDSVLRVFDAGGRNFGYMPRREWLRLDQTWEIRHPDISLIVLALEHEVTNRLEDILDDELQKLLDVKAFLKVLVWYPGGSALMVDENFSAPDIQEKIRSAKIKDSRERYVIMHILNEVGAIEVSACSFDADGKGEELGSFEVSYIPKD